MGYYTSFTIYATTPNGKNILNTELLEKIDKTIEGLDLNDFSGDNGYYYAYDTWYDEDTDMIAVSRKFPGVLFAVYGEGEESEDLWVDYFFNGGVQYEKAQITYGDFDPGKIICPDDQQPSDENAPSLDDVL